MRRDYLKCLRFPESVRRDLEFSDPDLIRLNPLTHRLELKENAAGAYPTDTDLYVRGPLWNPQALTEWKGFHVDPLEGSQPTGTSVGLRLSDGTDDFWWNGATWAVAGAGEWSTESELSGNIGSFPVDGRKLQIVVNLLTTDPTVTPTVEAIHVLMEADFDYLASIVADSLVPSLRESFGLLVVDFALLVDAGGTLISLLDLETPLNVVDVLEVYNHTTDPDHLTDIFASFDSTTEQVTVSTPFGAGQAAWLKLQVAPEIRVNWASQDYLELAKLPAVVIDRVDVVGNEVWGAAAVRHKAATPRPLGTVQKVPYRITLDLTLTLIGEKNRTLYALQDRALKHAAETPVLQWRAVDEKITMHLVGEGGIRPRPDLRDEHSSSYSLRLIDVFAWLRPSEQVNLIEQVNLDLTRRP